MKKFSTLLATAALTLGCLSGSSAYYDQNSYDCCDNSCPQFSLSADFLLWKPNIDELEWAAVTTLTGAVNDATFNTHYMALCPEWEPGIRGRVGVSMWNMDLSVGYTYLSGDQKKSLTAADDAYITAPFMHSSLIEPAVFGLFRSAESRYEYTYHNWDVLSGFLVADRCNMQLNGVFGATGLYLTQKWGSAYVTPENDPLTGYAPSLGAVAWKSDFWGVGLKAGTEFSYSLNDCLSVFGNAYASLLTGNPENRYVAGRLVTIEVEEEPIELTSTVSISDDDDSWILVPGYHLQAGVRYSMDICGTDVGIRAGYEFLNWHNTPTARRYMSSVLAGATLGSSANITTFGFHGLFAGLDVSF